MTPLGDADPAPTTQDIIDLCGDELIALMRGEMGDENDPDRIYLLRTAHRNMLYYRDLQNYAPSYYQGLLAGNVGFSSDSGDQGTSINDYSQNILKGYCRKYVAVLGTRMANMIAVPDNPEDEKAVKAARAANSAAYYIRMHTGFQKLTAQYFFETFQFGTVFFVVDWVIDGKKYGYDAVPDIQMVDKPLGNAAFNCQHCGISVPADQQNPVPPAACPQCGAPMSMADFQPPQTVTVPQQVGVKQKERGGLEIKLYNCTEFIVPMDARNTEDPECTYARLETDHHKSILLEKWGDRIRNSDTNDVYESVAAPFAESIRSSMASPIGLVRPKRTNRWTESVTWLKPCQFEMITKDEGKRDLLKQNFPKGLRITMVRGNIVDLKHEALVDHVVDSAPEMAARIMTEPPANDWVQAQDLKNNVLNLQYETLERSTLPMLVAAGRIDQDAWQLRRSNPGDIFPIQPLANRPLSDAVYSPPPVTFSEQTIPWSDKFEDDTRNNTGLVPPIFGGGGDDEPTARQAVLKKNAALMQLGIPWNSYTAAIEKVYEKACALLAQSEDGVLSFAQKNQFGGYNSIPIVMADLQYGHYHFEADEAIPMTWGQKQDLLMRMLEMPEQIQTMWGLNDPLNIFEFKQGLGMPGERTPLLDDRDKAMQVIGRLLQDQPQQQQDGSPKASIDPDWEDNHDFCARLAKAFLQSNPTIKEMNPAGYQNVQLWGQAQEQMSQQQPAPPKASVTLALKGADLGSAAVQQALTNANIAPNAQVQPDPKLDAVQAQMLASGSTQPPISKGVN